MNARWRAGIIRMATVAEIIWAAFSLQANGGFTLLHSYLVDTSAPVVTIDEAVSCYDRELAARWRPKNELDFHVPKDAEDAALAACPVASTPEYVALKDVRANSTETITTLERQVLFWPLVIAAMGAAIFWAIRGFRPDFAK